MTRNPRLMQPLQLRGQTLRNRIVFGAHTANLGKNGLPDAQYAAYLRERALGGAAMMVAGPVPTRGTFLHSDDAVIVPFRAVTQRARDAGAVILRQL